MVNISPSETALCPPPEWQGPVEQLSVDVEPVDAEYCPNCEAERTGVFCAQCGQRFMDGRLTFRQLWETAKVQLFRLEQGVVHTIIRMTVDPGDVARRYVQGQRRRFINPLTYFLIGGTVSLLTFSLYEHLLAESLIRQFTQQWGQNEQMLEDFKRVLGPDPAQAYTDFYLTWMKRLYTYLMLLLCIPFVLLLRLFFSERQSGYNFAETSVFTLFTVGHGLIVTGLVIPGVVFALGAWGSSAVTIALLAGIAGHAAYGFYDRRMRSAVLGALAFLGAYLAYFAVFGLAGAAWGVYVALSG